MASPPAGALTDSGLAPGTPEPRSSGAREIREAGEIREIGGEIGEIGPPRTPMAGGNSAEDAAAGGCWIEVVLLESRGPPGAATAAFWRFAHGVRNDVVRDTRRWRRQAQ